MARIFFVPDAFFLEYLSHARGRRHEPVFNEDETRKLGF